MVKYYNLLSVLIGVILTFLLGADCQAKVEISFNTAASDAANAPVLAAQVSSNAVFLSGAVSGSSASRTAERQKCMDLLRVGGDDVDKIFDGAVSPLTASIVVTENRAAEDIGQAWKNAIEELAISGNFKFDYLSGVNYVPAFIRVDFTVNAGTFSDKIPGGKLSERLLVKIMEGELNYAVSKQIDEFSRTGIFRLQSNSQGAVCYLMLSSLLQLNVAISARTFDRITSSPILDRACVVDLISNINNAFSRQKLKLNDIKTKSAFDFVFGYLLASNAGKKGGLWIKRSNVCARDDGELQDSNDVLAQWTKIAENWWVTANQRGSLDISVDNIQAISKDNSREITFKTIVNYRYDGLSLKGDAP
jgi:hypothetical protein